MNDRELDRLLSADRNHLQHETGRALQSGLLHRLSIAATSAQRQPRIAVSAVFALSAALLLICALVISRWTLKNSAPVPVTAQAVPAPISAVPSQPSAIAKTPAAARRRASSNANHAKPFPSPSPLSAEERTLVLIARSSSQEKVLILAQQQQLNDDFVAKVQQFKEKIQQQEGEPQ